MTKQHPATPIRAGLNSKSRLRGLVENGLGAVKKTHKDYIESDLRDAFGDSLDIDLAFQEAHDQENRWDYLLGHDATQRIYGLEPHSAHDKEVKVVIKKRKRSLEHLREHLAPGVVVADWFWVASGRVDFTAHDKTLTLLQNNGIAFVGKQLLAKKLGGGSKAKAKKGKR